METEVTNTASLKLYERLGFLRSKRLHRYYLNGNTAFRLVLYLRDGTGFKQPSELDQASQPVSDPAMEDTDNIGHEVKPGMSTAEYRMPTLNESQAYIEP